MKKYFKNIWWFVIPALIAGIATQFFLEDTPEIVYGTITYINENKVCNHMEVDIKNEDGVKKTYIMPFESVYNIRKMLTSIDDDENNPVVVTVERVANLCNGLNAFEIKYIETVTEPEYIDVDELMKLIKEYSE